MIAAWMAYCIAISLALAVAGGATDRALYLTGRPTRWAWSVALLGTLLLPLAAIVRPQAFGTSTVPLPAPALRGSSGATSGWTPDAAARASLVWRGRTWTELDGVVGWGWGLASGALLVVLGGAATRLAALRRGWRPALVDGCPVLIADDVGPAVAGLWPPRIVIPSWALELAERQRRLMLAHEEEHVSARDPWLLAAGTAALVLTPWNPAAWWLVRRLRLAVEMDCDARVLARGHSTPDYGELLLQVGQHRAHLPLTAAALGEPQSFLERRIRRMAARRPRWRWLGATAAFAIAAAGVIAACEAPPPTASEVPQATVERGGRVDHSGVSAADVPQATDLYDPSADSLRRLAHQYQTPPSPLSSMNGIAWSVTRQAFGRRATGCAPRWWTAWYRRFAPVAGARQGARPRTAGRWSCTGRRSSTARGRSRSRTSDRFSCRHHRSSIPGCSDRQGFKGG